MSPLKLDEALERATRSALKSTMYEMDGYEMDGGASP